MSIAPPNFYPGNFETNLRFLNDNSPEVVFTKLGADRWIRNCIVYKDGSIDVEATAVQTGVPIHYGEHVGEVSNAYASTTGILDRTEPVEIYISDVPHRLRDGSVSLGHEFGHIFLDRMLRVCSANNPREEDFCNYFGLMLAIPAEELETIERIDEAAIVMLAERLRASHGSVIERFMRAGRLPSRVAYDARLSMGTDEYRGKITRQVICLGCIKGDEHALDDDVMELPVFNFTPYDIYSSTKDTSDHGETLFDRERFALINRLYEQ